MIEIPKDKVSYAVICERFPNPQIYFDTYDLAVRWLKMKQLNDESYYIVKRTEHFEVQSIWC